MTNISHALATALIETAEQDGGRFRWESVFQWEAASNRVRIEALDDPTGRLQGAIAAAAAIDAESCVDCRGPGEPHRAHPDGPVRTRCRECAAPWEAPVRATWAAPADAIMTPAEAAADGWTEPATCKRLRCFGWSVENATELLNDKAACAIEHKHGWNHLVRALLRLTLASQEPEPWTVRGLKEKWGYLVARCEPGTTWRHGALHLFRTVSGRTCSRCGRPGTMRNHCDEGFGVRPLCDSCEALFQEDGKTPNGRYDRMVSDYAEHERRRTGSDTGRERR